MTGMSFEEELAGSGRLVCPNKGTSMMPLIRQGKDLMVIFPRPDRRLKRFEAVLYKRGGSYILHRVYQVREGDYVMCADNRRELEEGVKDEQIIGVLGAVLRDGERELPVSGFAYRSYVFFWYRVRPIASKIKRKIFKLLGR